MTGEEAEGIFKFIKNSYPGRVLFDDEEQKNVWFNMLNRFEYKDIRSGVREYIATNNRPPAVSDIVMRTEQAYKARKNAEAAKFREYSKSKTVSCRVCNDTGYILFTTKTGIEKMKPCNCAAGHANFPWLWTTEQEDREWVQNEQKAGRNAQMPYRTKDYEKFRYWYEDSDRQTQKPVETHEKVDLLAKLTADKEDTTVNLDAFNELFEGSE